MRLFSLCALLLCAPLAFSAPWVEMQTNRGRIVLELDELAAPETVENFLKYAESGFYEGTVFHRVIPGFMVQGGGYDENLAKKPTRGPIANESQNGLTNTRGTVAMARTNDPHSATSQFFINVVDNPYLNRGGADPYGYTVFGEVREGMEVVDAIAKVKTHAAGPFASDVPVVPVVIYSVTVFAAPAPEQD